MHFVDNVAYHKLSSFDIASLLEIKAYPIRRSTLNTLPNWALSELYDKGHIRITAIYDSTNGEFDEIQKGWNRNINTLDQVLALASKLDGDIVSAVYYLAYQDEVAELGQTEKMADIRDIQEKSVKDAIRNVKEEIE